MKKLESSELVTPLLQQIGEHCDNLKSFTETNDFPYHKQYYYNRVVQYASAMLLLAGEILAIHRLQEHDITETEYSDTQEELITSLKDCKIDL